MTRSPTLSIVIVTWQSRADVLACLDSIRDNVTVDREVIVVDDGSTDGTADAVRSSHPDATVVVRPVNGGLVAGRNDALRVARGEYVLMLDADTRVRAGAVEAMVSALERDPAVGLVGARLVLPGGELQLSCFRWPPLLLPLMRRGPYARWIDDDPPAHRRHSMKDFDHRAERPVVWVAGAAQMYRRELAHRLGAYDPRISSYGGEDLDWCLRVWAAGMAVHYVPEAGIDHVSQRVTHRRRFGRKSLRALRDWLYLQAKHRKLRRDPRLAAARA